MYIFYSPTEKNVSTTNKLYLTTYRSIITVTVKMDFVSCISLQYCKNTTFGPIGSAVVLIQEQEKTHILIRVR